MHLNQLIKVFAFTISVRCVKTKLRNEEPALQTRRHTCFTHVTQTQNQETAEFREIETEVWLNCCEFVSLY